VILGFTEKEGMDTITQRDIFAMILYLGYANELELNVDFICVHIRQAAY